MSIDAKEIVKQINIVDLISNFATLTKAGSSYKTLCNVHGDTTPSLSINPRKQIYKCFVCDHGGDALDYLIWSQKFTYQDAIKYIANLAGIELKDHFNKKNHYNEKQLNQINCLKEANNLFKYYLDVYSSSSEQLNDFIIKRKLTKESINKFSLGFSPRIDDENYLNVLAKKAIDETTLINTSLKNVENNQPFFINRLIIPIFDEYNNPIAFAGRDITNQSNIKYIHSSESLVFKKNNVIYNYNNAKSNDTLIIVEGFLDVISLDKIGINNAVALMGVSLSQNQINKLKQHKEIIVFLDNDEAGVKSAKNIIINLLKNNINSSIIINNTEYKDVDEIVNNGESDNVNNLIKNRIPSQIFIYEALAQNTNPNNPNDLMNFFNSLNQYWNLFDKYSKNIIFKKIVNDLKISENEVIDFLNLSNNDVLKYNNKLNRKTNDNKFNVLTFDKILLALYKNPNLLTIQYLGNINWSYIETKKVKLFSELKRWFFDKQELSSESIEILNKYDKLISAYQIPKSEEQLVELINRHNKIDSSKAYIKKTYNDINSSTNDDDKWDTLELKIAKLSEKIKE